MSFYRNSYAALREAAGMMDPVFWAWVTAHSSDERLLYLTSRGDTDALKRILRTIERGGVREADLPYTHRTSAAPDSPLLRAAETRQQVIDWPTLSPLDRTFLAWAYRFYTLTYMELPRTGVSDLTPLRDLVSLQEIDLGHTPVRDLAPLSDLSLLRELTLYGTPVWDLRPLAGLTQLQTLHLGRTEVKDLSPLRGLTQLHSLYLGLTEVTDLSPLLGLPQLRALYLSGTQVPRAQVVRLRAAIPYCEIYR